MLNYEPGDIATFYFVIKDDNNEKIIKGWTDRKQLLDFYMEFHKCPKFKIKKVTKPIEEIHRITEENNHDEIAIGNFYVKDREGKLGDKKLITIPITENEFRFVREECATALASRIGYAYLNGALPYLKGKYQEALADIYLSSMINKTVHNKNDKYNQVIDFDQLMVLFKSFPDEFGR